MNTKFNFSYKYFPFFIVLVMAISYWAFAGNSDNKQEQVSLQEAKEMLEKKQVIIFDVREVEEHQQGVAAGMRLLPLSELANRKHEIVKDQPVLLICNTQNRSQRALAMLKKEGWNNLRYVNHGMSAWAKNNWPMVKPNCALNAQHKLSCS